MGLVPNALHIVKQIYSNMLQIKHPSLAGVIASAIGVAILSAIISLIILCIDTVIFASLRVLLL